MDLFFRRGKDMLIYNFVSPTDGPTWEEYTNTLLDVNKMYPLHNAIYIPLMTNVKHKILSKICIWFGHFLPALLMDIASLCINRKPRYHINLNVFITRCIPLMVY